MKRLLAGIIIGVVILCGVKAYAGLIDMCQREGQTNQLVEGNQLMKENNKLLTEIRDLLKSTERGKANG